MPPHTSSERVMGTRVGPSRKQPRYLLSASVEEVLVKTVFTVAPEPNDTDFSINDQITQSRSGCNPQSLPLAIACCTVGT